MSAEYLCIYSAGTTQVWLSGVDRRPRFWLQPCLFSRYPSRFTAESGYPTLPRTVGAQCEHHRRSDDILPTSQSLTVPDTPASDCVEIDRSFLCTFSLTVPLPVFIWHMTGRETQWGGTSLQSRPFWAMASLAFGIRRRVTRTQSNWADLSYPLLTECTLVWLLQRRDFDKCSSRCFHTLVPLWICKRESRLIDCWRGNTTLLLYCKPEDHSLYNWICRFFIKLKYFLWVDARRYHVYIDSHYLSSGCNTLQCSLRIQFWQLKRKTSEQPDEKAEYSTNQGTPLNPGLLLITAMDWHFSFFSFRQEKPLLLAKM